jgi:hypothetical protein
MGGSSVLRGKRRALLVLALAGCGGVTYTSASPDGGDAGAPDAASSDASIGAPDGSGADASGADAQGNAGGDAGSDAADAGSPPLVLDAQAYDGSAFACINVTAAFCSDFDENINLTKGWDMGPLQVPPGATVATDNTIFASPTRAALFSFGGDAGGGAPMPLWLEKDNIALPATEPFTLSFDWYVTPSAQTNNAEVLRATAMGTPAGEVDLFLTSDQAKGGVAHFEVWQGQGGAAAVHTVGQSFLVPHDEWVHVLAKFDAQNVTLSVDDNVVTAVAFPYDDATYRTMNLQIGLGFGAADVRFDDVVVQ